MVVLAEDALGLRRRDRSHRSETHREITKLVLRHEERKTETLIVVLVPHPRPVHLRIRQIDGRSDEPLDGFRDRRHQSATAGTPATVSEATRSTTLCK